MKRGMDASLDLKASAVFTRLKEESERDWKAWRAGGYDRRSRYVHRDYDESTGGECSDEHLKYYGFHCFGSYRAILDNESWLMLDSEDVYRRVEEMVKEEMNAAAWWGGLPSNSRWLLDTSVFMCDALGMDEWFASLPRRAKEKKSTVFIVGAVLEELVKNSKDADKTRAYKARLGLRRMENLQKEDTKRNFLGFGGISLKDHKEYADPFLIIKSLGDVACILLSFDRSLRIRLMAKAKEKNRTIKSISLDDYNDYIKIPSRDFVWRVVRRLKEGKMFICTLVILPLVLFVVLCSFVPLLLAIAIILLLGFVEFLLWDKIENFLDNRLWYSTKG